MAPLLSHTLLAFGSLVSIVDPFAAVPIFLGLAGAQPRDAQRATAFRATLTCLVVLTAFAGAGTVIFSFFGITIPAFKVAGGALLFGVGLDMMRAKDKRTTDEEQHEAASKEDVGLIPLGLPLLAGPGAIATVMVLVGKTHDPTERAAVHVAILAVSVLTFAILASATFIGRVLGRTGINVIGRIMGLILAAVAMQFVFDGLREAFPHLFGA